MKKILAFILILPFVFSMVSPPEKYLGFKVGEDRKLANYEQIVGYLRTLESTKRLKLLKIGETTLKRDMFIAVISSRENMKRLSYYRDLEKRIYFGHDPSVIKKAKPVYLISCTIHSSEIGASQMSMELAYRLVTLKDPRAKEILKNNILLLVPSSNPDGIDMVVDWYKKTVGTKDEGKSMPWLYHYYAGHDDNRDWYMLNLVETRNLTKVFYREWFPVVIQDEHQMGSTGARLFLPPFKEPASFSVNPLVWRLVNLMGTYMAYKVEESGKSGVLSYNLFTAWWIGALDDTAWFHNSIGLLSEMASAKYATPVYVEKNELSISWSDRSYGKMVSFPNPWKGGWWRPRNIVNYELELSLAGLDFVAKNHEEILRTIYKVNRDEESLGKEEKPYGFVIPEEQEDPVRTGELMERLMWGGVKVYKLKEDLGIYRKGDFYIPLSQPYRPYIMELFKRGKYPLEEPPYDTTTCNLPIQMGINYLPVNERLNFSLKEVKNPYPESKIIGRGKYYCLDPKVNFSYRAAAEASKKGGKILRNAKNGEICLTSISRDSLEKIAGENHIKIKAQRNLTKYFEKISVPRIAVYKQWGHIISEGWLRYFLDNYKISYKVIHNDEIKKEDLNKNYDLIIIPSLSAKRIVKGTKGQTRRWYSLPEKYSGGIGKEGVKNLKKFAENGGRIVLMGRAVELAWENFKLPVVNGLKGVKDFFCPQAFVKIKVNKKLPLGLGFDNDTTGVFYGSVAMRTFISPEPYMDRRVVAYFPEGGDILISGYLKGEKYLKRLAAVVDVKYKRGRFHLLGINVLYRNQAEETFRFLLNAIFYPKVKW